ncbi:AAA family ATPase [Pontibacter sp. G13]|uniref:ParA family protein n=1 Tax=Pontibacter sp. G13 TaxID=3074898 RepID=UPI00288B9098|nr:AAA family ATPase [Pontibacter sp. G13]WNJ21601.1 AAA family ATPase [Pontibacter sp. G13]
MKIFALYNLKGGVGKTASSVNLAFLSAQENLRTLLWDLDPQGAATYYYDLTPRLVGGAERLLSRRARLQSFAQFTQYSNLEMIPADLSNRNMDLLLDDQWRSSDRFDKMLKGLKSDYDVVFIDCPPVLSVLAEHLFRAADYVLFPTVPTTLSERAFAQVVEFFGKFRFQQDKIIPFFSMVDERRMLHRKTIGSFSNTYQQVLQHAIPNADEVELMGEHQAPIFTYADHSEAAQAYRHLWEEIKALP